MIQRKGGVPIRGSGGEFLVPCPWCFRTIGVNSDEFGGPEIEHTRERCRGWRSECMKSFFLRVDGYERSDGVRIGTEEFERRGSDH